MFQLLKDWLDFKVRMKHLKRIDKEIKKMSQDEHRL